VPAHARPSLEDRDRVLSVEKVGGYESGHAASDDGDALLHDEAPLDALLGM